MNEAVVSLLTSAFIPVLSLLTLWGTYKSLVKL